VLEQLSLLPEQAVELRSIVAGPQPAEEDEVLRRGDGRDGVDLQEAEPSDRVENVCRGAVEEL